MSTKKIEDDDGEDNGVEAKRKANTSAPISRPLMEDRVSFCFFFLPLRVFNLLSY